MKENTIFFGKRRILKDNTGYQHDLNHQECVFWADRHQNHYIGDSWHRHDNRAGLIRSWLILEVDEYQL